MSPVWENGQVRETARNTRENGTEKTHFESIRFYYRRHGPAAHHGCELIVTNHEKRSMMLNALFGVGDGRGFQN